MVEKEQEKDSSSQRDNFFLTIIFQKEGAGFVPSFFSKNLT